jgi:hypothetical protein
MEKVKIKLKKIEDLSEVKILNIIIIIIIYKKLKKKKNYNKQKIKFKFIIILFYHFLSFIKASTKRIILIQVYYLITYKL